MNYSVLDGMWRSIVVFSASSLFSFYSYAQIKKQFYVEDHQSYDRIELAFRSNSGDCYIKPSAKFDALNVYSNQELDAYSHSFSKDIQDQTCFINLDLEDTKSEGLSQSISLKMFGKSEEETDKLWKVYLTNQKPYCLDLNYGIGSAYVDLSGLAIQKLKIHTGSADVNVGYFSGMDNQIEMDTLFVKVDWGSAEVKKVNLSKSKKVIAEVGFGNLLLDFTDKVTTKSDISGSVGAGNLVILLPESQTPVKVNVRNSWLCQVKLPKSFQKTSGSTFVNGAYKEDAGNLLSFDLDVSMGSIVFKEK